MHMQILRVQHYGETPADDRRVTIQVANINTVVAMNEDTEINGRSLRHVSVLYVSGNSIDLTVNHADLELLESATGSFCLG